MEYRGLKILTDVIFFIIALVPSAVLYILESPTLMYQRGFYCNDESIKYPYKEDTVSVGVLVAVGVFVPVATMIICEWVIYRYFVTKRMEVGSNWQPYLRRKLCCCSLHPWASALYATIGPFLLGAAYTLLLTDAGKYVIGRLRPHFISVCEPDWSMINCTNADGYIYVEDIPCLKGDKHLLTDARLSFPSGHSSSAFFFFIYWVVYLQRRMVPEIFGDTLLRPFLQILGILAAMLVSLSRVSDYKHHWSDVLAGSTLGLVMVLFSTYLVSDLFKISVSREAKIEKGEVMPLYGSGSAISEQISNDSKDHANNDHQTLTV